MWCVGNEAKPVTIRGISYPSMSAAARALGVHRTAIYWAIKNNRLDLVGLKLKGAQNAKRFS